MKVKQISDSTLKITIKMDDLEERGMELADFLIPQEKTEEFFYTVLDELELPLTFRESGMLSFRVTPKPDRVDIFVTKSDLDKQLQFDDLSDWADLEDISNMTPEEFIKNMEQIVREKSTADSKAVRHLEKAEQADALEQEESEPYIYYILEFENIQDVFSFVATVDYAVEESELYKMNGNYYMTVLVAIEERSSSYPEYLLSRMLEYTEDTQLSRAVLLEHATVLVAAGAIDELRKIQ